MSAAEAPESMTSRYQYSFCNTVDQKQNIEVGDYVSLAFLYVYFKEKSPLSFDKPLHILIFCY